MNQNGSDYNYEEKEFGSNKLTYLQRMGQCLSTANDIAALKLIAQ